MDSPPSTTEKTSMDMSPQTVRPRRAGRFWLTGKIALIFFAMSACSGSSDAAPVMPVKPPKGELAFPGAVGFGAISKGGRNGRIMFVTNLDDSGNGSLRHCIEADEPRMCIFNVAGIIRFTRKPPFIRNPYITIAGQTAPGGGIILTHSGGVNGMTPLVIKNTHDVVIRHIRVRPDRIGTNPEAEDAITVENGKNIILDHVSGSWARDENINTYADNDNVTISNSIFAEGIPRHDKCALLGSDITRPQNLSFIGNICAHNGDRNPDINFTPGSCIEIFNNILYDAQSQFAEIWSSYGGSPVALVGNIFRKGPSTTDRAVGVDVEIIGATGKAKIFLHDNYFDGRFKHMSPLVDELIQAQPSCPFTMMPMPSATAYEMILKSAGAFPRDTFDQKIARQIRDRTGHIVKRAGQIAPVKPGVPYPDLDRDGMDDEWEKQYGADATIFDPWSKTVNAQMTNMDAFLDYRHQLAINGI